MRDQGCHLKKKVMNNFLYEPKSFIQSLGIEKGVSGNKVDNQVIALPTWVR